MGEDGSNIHPAGGGDALPGERTGKVVNCFLQVFIVGTQGVLVRIVKDREEVSGDVLTVAGFGEVVWVGAIFYSGFIDRPDVSGYGWDDGPFLPAFGIEAQVGGGGEGPRYWQALRFRWECLKG